MPPAPARTSIVLAVAAACAALFAGHAFAQLPDKLPLAPDYRGEIRRGADGKLIALPVTEAGLGKLAGEVAPKATMRVGSGEKIATIGEAARLAKDGEVIEIRPGAYRGQPAVWTQDKLLIRGAGERPVMIADGRSAEDKAIWVVRGGRVRIENIEFRGARVTDGNGAGIRFEKGSLSIRNCRFTDNEMGVLTGNAPELSLEISDSEFLDAPRHAGDLHHLLYVGAIGRFVVRGSRFQNGYLGHLLKSRARENHVLYNMLADGKNGRASYELEFPNGGIAYVIGNAIGQGAGSENQTIVSYGAEGPRWPVNGLYLAHNTLVNYGWLPAWFLRVLGESLPQPAEVHAVNNLVVGPGIFWLGAGGHFEGNRYATAGMLRDIDTYAFELPPGAVWRGAGIDPRKVGGQDLSPRAEFKWPLGIEKLAPDRTGWTPGAYQR